MTISKYSISFALYLRGDELQPSILTQILGVEPTDSQRKGDQEILSTGRVHVKNIGVWIIASSTNSSNISDHIKQVVPFVDQIERRLNTEYSSLDKLPGVDEAYLDVFVCGLNTNEGVVNCEFEFSKEEIASLKRFNLPVKFTVGIAREKGGASL